MVHMLLARVRRQAVLLAGVALLAAPAVAPSAALAATPPVPSSWVLGGAGYGHGIGMSQYGAEGMAVAGRSAKEILAHYYTGTTYDVVPDDQILNVNLLNAVTSAALSTSTIPGTTGGGSLSITNGTAMMTGGTGAALTVSRSGAAVAVSCPACSPTTLSGSTLTVTFAGGGTLLRVAGTDYDVGTVVVTPTGASAVNVVTRVRLHDEYLDRLAEVPWSWLPAALQAQAAAARGYALSKYAGGIKSSCNCHLTDTTSDQVYGGYPVSGNLPWWTYWKNAVRAAGSPTGGLVARYEGQVIQAFYFSSSGGRTENNEDVWGGPAIPYLRSVDDPWSLTSANPSRSWQATVSQSALAGAFGLADVVRLDLSSRTAGTGVDSATASSSSGATKTISGQTLRSRLGLRSTWLWHRSARLAGQDRYATAVAVAQQIPVTAATGVIASGLSASLPDAAVSGPLALASGGPLLLTSPTGLPVSLLAELDRRREYLKKVFVVGGAGAVSDVVVSQLIARGITVERLGGADRYTTAALVAAKVAALRPLSTVVVASGSSLVDALAASGPASKLTQPILLTSVAGLPAATSSAVAQTGASSAIILGGTAVVSDTVQQAVGALGLSTVRLAGANRYESAAAIAAFYRPMLTDISDVVLTSGDDGSLVDSLAAGQLGRLMVLTATNGVPAPSLKVLQTTAALTTVTVVGGTAVVTGSALTQAARS